MKKLYSFLLMLVLSTIVFTENVKAGPMFAGGSGTSGDPYQITLVSHLNNVRNFIGSGSTGVYFKLMNDLDLTTYLASGGDGYTLWGTSGWLPIGDASNPFLNQFNGNNHKITNLQINRGTTDYIGLFGNIGYGGEVINLGVENATIVGQNYVGGLSGKCDGTVSSCHSTGTISGASSVGGLLGYTSSHCIISKSYSTCAVSGTNSVGGLAGYFYGIISNCYATGSVTGTSYGLGGLTGMCNFNTITYSYATGAVSGATSYKGGLNGFSDNPGTISDCYWDKQTTGMETSYFASYDAEGAKTTAEMKTQSTFAGWDFSFPIWKIDGTTNNGYPFLAEPIVAPTTQASSIVFSAIQATQMTIGWTNGNGVKRAVFVKEGTGAITNPSDNTTCTASTNWTSKGTQLGTSGYYCVYNDNSNSITLTGLTVCTQYTVQVFEYNGTAGSEKYNTSTATDNPKSQTTQTFEGNGTSGDPYLISSVAQLAALAANVNSGTNYSGLFFKQTADLDLNVSPYNTGTGWPCIGNSTSNKFSGTYDGDGYEISNLFINNDTYSSGIGLFGGYFNGTVKNLGLINISINGNSKNGIGGIVGWSMGTIQNCYVSSGSISGYSYVAGFVGCTSSGTIEQCYSSGISVTGHDMVGGLVGYNNGANIYNCFSKSNVTASYGIVGGLVGYHNGNGPGDLTIDKCYSIGTATGTTSVGGLIGQLGSYATVTNSYWDKETSGLTNSGGGTGKTTSEMTTQSTYTSWDFVTTPIWHITGSENDGYPHLAWQVFTIFAPTIQASEIVFSNIQTTQMAIGWTNGNGANRAVFVKAGSGAITNPSDNTTYTASADWESKGTQLGTSGYYCIYNGNNNSVTLTGLTPATEYTVQVFEYNDVANSEKYKTITATNNPKSQITATPCINPTDGGIIDEDQAGCTPLDPALITSSILPAGHTGTLDYKWQQSTTSSSAGFSDIASSNASTYNPNSISVTTWYKRLARVTCKTDWIDAAESNIVAITVSPEGVGGSISGTTEITYGSSTGTMTLSGQTGTVEKWQKMFGSGSWADIANSTTTCSETPTSAGSWQYRAQVKNGTCPVVFSEPLSITVSLKELTVSGTTVAGKTYNGNAEAAITVGILSGFIGSETVTATAVGTFDSKNVGNRTATAVYTLADGTNGGLASNYSLGNTTSLVASITPKSLAIVGTTAEDKIYDGITNAAITVGTLSGFIGSETVTATAVGAFDSKNVGNRIATAVYTLADGTNGGLASNYSLSNTTNLLASITTRSLEITATTGQTKQFGEVDPVLTYTVTNGSLVLDDVLTGALTRTAGEAVGTYEIQIGTLSAGTNYNISFVAADFTITPVTGIYPDQLSKVIIYSDSKEIFVQIPVLNGTAQLRVYSILGYQLYNTVNMSQGFNRIRGNFMTGTYIVKLVAGNKVYTQKVMLIK